MRRKLFKHIQGMDGLEKPEKTLLILRVEKPAQKIENRLILYSFLPNKLVEFFQRFE